MGDMRDDVARSNIERYGRLLKRETDPEKLRILARLLDDARAELQYRSPTGDTTEAEARWPVASPDEARRWHMKSEECRTIAESCRSEAARETFLRLARSYAILAERADGRKDKVEPKPRSLS
jgi:hypothetical protein